MEYGGAWARESWLKYCPRDLPLTASFSLITLVTVVINPIHLGAWQAEHRMQPCRTLLWPLAALPAEWTLWAFPLLCNPSRPFGWTLWERGVR